MDLDCSCEEAIEDMATFYSVIFPYLLCPPELFFELIRINYLRSKVSASLILGEIDPRYTLEAEELLARLEAFKPQDWAQPGKHYEEWLLIGTMYQDALAIYCIISMQALAVFPNAVAMNARRRSHGDRLLESLRAALDYPRVRRFFVWPIVVAGVEAAYRGEGTRVWIERLLIDTARYIGTYSPLTAASVLRKYWDKKQWGWDECFDRPYIFIT